LFAVSEYCCSTLYILVNIVVKALGHVCPVNVGFMVMHDMVVFIPNVIPEREIERVRE
jgi:hypothetical protein